MPFLSFSRRLYTFLFVVFSFFHFTLAIPAWERLARQVRNETSIKDAYDYIVVGGGTAGLTVADRLSEDGKYTVLVIEHGYFSQYNITSIPQPALANRSIAITLGHCVGGSSAINGMAMMRGSAAEYAIWAELGGPGSSWDWDGLLPYFKKAANFVPPSSLLVDKFQVKYDEAAWGSGDANGTATGVFASYPGGLDPRIMTMYEALRAFPGVRVPRDGGQAGVHGLFYYPVSVDPGTGRRSYARTAHWDRVSHRPNYDIITGSKVNRVIFEGKTAVGVTFVPKHSINGTHNITSIKARKEVVLAAGAIHTPQILQLSGIGASALLKQANISVTVDLPGVGANLQDHPVGPPITYTWGHQPPVPFNVSWPPGGEGKEQGLVAVLSLPVMAPSGYRRIANRYAAQDLRTVVPKDTPRSVLAGYRAQQDIYAREMRRSRVSFSNNIVVGGATPGIVPVGMHVTSRGSVRLDPQSRDAEPLVDFAALANPVDLDLMVAYIKFVRAVFASPSLARYEPRELSPGSNVTTDEDLYSWVRSVYTPFGYHPAGTAAKMPRELGGVVGEDLLVHGVERLSVVDASIMPTLIGGATQFTVYAVAEKAAALIKERQEA